MVDQAVSAVGSIVGGSASYAAGKYNKKVSYNAAVEAERDGAAQVLRVRDAARKAISAQGASGFQIGTGSALDALTESQINATMDALNVRREASARARGLRVQGDQAMSAGKNAYTAGLFQSASSVMDMKADWGAAKAGSTGGKPGPGMVVYSDGGS